MSAALAHLPDERTVYVEGYGVTTIGALVVARTEDARKVDDETEATYQMWEDIGTRNLLRRSWEKPVTVSDIVAYHGSRYTRGRTPRAGR